MKDLFEKKNSALIQENNTAELLNRTNQALAEFNLDPHDIKSIAGFEKLVKLHAILDRLVQKQKDTEAKVIKEEEDLPL